MTANSKLWLLRIISVPVMLLFPFIGMSVPLALGTWKGSFPMIENTITLAVLGIVAVWMSLRTVFASRDTPLRKGFTIFIVALFLEILGLSTNAAVAFIERPYERAKLISNNRQAASIQVTGEWKGTWTDPRKNVTQNIRLNLEQNGADLTGTIRSSDNEFTIISGTVSGDQINLFYDQKHSFRSRGATLLGTLRDGRLTGHYYAHDRPKRGWSPKGPWEATRKTD